MHSKVIVLHEGLVWGIDSTSISCPFDVERWKSVPFLKRMKSCAFIRVSLVKMREEKWISKKNNELRTMREDVKLRGRRLETSKCEDRGSGGEARNWRCEVLNDWYLQTSSATPATYSVKGSPRRQFQRITCVFMYFNGDVLVFTEKYTKRCWRKKQRECSKKSFKFATQVCDDDRIASKFITWETDGDHSLNIEQKSRLSTRSVCL